MLIHNLKINIVAEDGLMVGGSREGGFYGLFV